MQNEQSQPTILSNNSMGILSNTFPLIATMAYRDLLGAEFGPKHVSFDCAPDNMTLDGVNGAGVCIPSSDLLRLRQQFQSRDAVALMQDQREAVAILAAYGEIDPGDAQLQIEDLDREIATEQDVRDQANADHYADEQGDPNDPDNWWTPAFLDGYCSLEDARRNYRASFYD